MPLLISQLKNAKIYDSSFPKFNHFDFAFGRFVAKVQDVILKLENKILK